MKHVALTFLLCALTISLTAQTNAEVVGKTVTDSIVIKDGAVTGHILQSENGMGLGKWVHPDSVRDNLGNHMATTDLLMDSNSISGTAKIEFFRGQIIDPSDTTRLKFNSSIDLMCDTIFNVEQITFCAAGVATGTTLSDIGVIVAPTEVVLANAPPPPGGPAPVALGIGGPANPPVPGPFPPGPVPPGVPVFGFAGGPPPFFNLGVYGDTWSYDYWGTSDARFKTDIKHFDGALNKISRMKGVTYQMNQKDFPDRNFQPGKNYGFLAQDLLEVTPELVRQNSEGFLLVNYDGVIPILAEGIKELDKKTSLERAERDSEIESLRAENEMLQNRLDELEQLVLSKQQIKKRKKRNRN